MATREYNFVVGPETSTQPTVSDPTASADLVTLGYADENYVQGGSAVADITALKAVSAANRSDKDIRFVESTAQLYRFDSAASDTGDDDFVVTPSAGTGRWFKVAVNSVKDASFSIVDDADITKVAKFQASGITTATTRTFTLPDASGTLLYSGGPLGTPASGTATNLTGLPLTTGVTGTLPDDNGGTGQSTYTTGDTLYASATNTLAKLGIGSANQVLKVVNGVPAWGTPASGGINYINANPDAETDTTGWTAYADTQTATMTIASPCVVTVGSTTGMAAGDAFTFTTTGALPTGVTAGTTYYITTIVSGTTFRFSASLGGSDVNTSGSQSGTHKHRPLAPISGAVGGSAALTVTRTTTTPLRGSGSLLLTPSSSIGEGAYYTITPDLADYGNVLEFGFDFDWVSGTGTTGDFVVWIYDVASSTKIQPAGYQVPGAVTGIYGKYKCTFQVPATATTMRICIHQVTSGAPSLEIDNVYCGPQLKSYGPAVTDWVAWTPTGSWSSNTTYTGFYRQVGSDYEYDVYVATSGAPTSASLSINLPSGHTIDTAKLTAAAIQFVGDAYIVDVGVNQWPGYINYYPGTNTAVYVLLSGTAGTYGQGAGVTQAVPMTFGAGDYVHAHWKVPIVGKSSGQLLSSDADTRVVAMSISGTPSNSLTGSYGTVTFSGSASVDTHGAFVPSTGIYTIPVSGVYKISGYTATTFTASAGATSISSVQVYKNNSTSIASNSYALPNTLGAYTVGVSVPFDVTTQLNAGDTIRIQAYGQNSSSTMSTSYINIDKLSGPSQIAASETVAARYSTNAGQSIPNVTDTIVDFEDKGFDSHSSVTTGASWKFTAPISGKYRVSAGIAIAAIAGWVVGEYGELTIKKNGNAVSRGLNMQQGTHSGNVTSYITDTVSLIAGDYITISLYQSNGASVTLVTDSSYNYVSVERIGN